jgi:hypothetical protein
MNTSPASPVLRAATLQVPAAVEVATPTPALAMEPCRVEELKTKRATYLMNNIAKVGIFDGEPLELELFIEDMDAFNDLIRVNPLDDTTNRNI